MGDLKITKEEINGVITNVFRGVLEVRDDFDFNPANRDLIPELKTRVANVFLPGQGYNVYSSIQLIQYGNTNMKFATVGNAKATGIDQVIKKCI